MKSVLVLPPHDRWPAWTGHPPADGEDRERPYRLLAGHGYHARRIDTFGLPWNPLASAHPLLHALDPLRAFRVLLLHRRCAAVLGNFEASAMVVLLLRRILRFRGKVVVMDVGTPHWRLRRLVQDRVIPRADAVLVYTPHQAAAVRATWPGVRRVWAVSAQADCRFFAPAPDQPDGPVLAVGDDGSRDYGTLAQAAAGLDRTVLVRTGLPVGPAPPNLRVLDQPMPMPAYRDLLAAASVVVLPLHPVDTPGGVSVLVQAMASGKPVVVSASPGLDGYVQDGTDGLVVPPHDPAAMAAAIRRLLDDAGLRRRLGTAARATAERRFSYEAWAAQLAEVLDETCRPAPV